MKRSIFNLLIILLLLAVVFQSACSSKSAIPDEALTQSTGVPVFFHNIPADSPYVFTGMEPFPLHAFQGVFEQYGAALETLMELRDDIGAEMADLPEDQAMRVMFALGSEFRGKLSATGLESLGFSMQPHIAFYGVGLLPVYRISLHDPVAFEALLTRIESAVGIHVQVHTMGGVSYRLYRLDELLIPVSIQGNEVIVGVTPQQSADVYLPYMLGIKRPEESLAKHNQIQEIIDTYQVRPGLVGYLDLVGMVDTVFSDHVPGSIMAEIWQTLLTAEDETPEFSQACREEVRAKIAEMPRAVMGYEEFSTAKIQTLFALEFTSDFAARVSQLRTSIPGGSSPMSQESMASLGVGIDLQKLAAFIDQIMFSMQQNPSACEDFADINESVAEFPGLSGVLPGFLADIQGASVIIKRASLGDGGDPEDPMELDAVALVHSKDPTGLFQALQMFSPFLAEVELNENGVTPVPDTGMGEFALLLSPHFLKTAKFLGFSLGRGMQDEMAAMVEQESIALSQTPLVQFSFDYAQFAAELMKSLGGEQVDYTLYETVQGMISMFQRFDYSLDASQDAVFMRFGVHLNMTSGNP